MSPGAVRVEGLSRGPAPARVTHDLSLSLDDVRDIADRHQGAVELHLSALPVLLPSGRRRALDADAAVTVSRLAESENWLTLFRVGDDVALRGVADALRDQLAPGWGAADLQLSLVCSSALGVTPAHMDSRDVLLLQLVGTKVFHTGEYAHRADREAELRRRFGPGRENLRQLPEQQREWVLTPGQGILMPAYTPHWALVGDDVSVALSIFIGTPGLVRREAEHAADAVFLLHGLRLPAPGRSAALDRGRAQAVRAVRAARKLLRGRR